MRNAELRETLPELNGWNFRCATALVTYSSSVSHSAFSTGTGVRHPLKFMD